MKQLIVLMVLSLASVAVSAQEVVETQGDTSYREGRKLLKKLKPKTKGRHRAQSKNDTPSNSSDEFRQQTQEMTRLLKSFKGAIQRPLPQEQDVETAHEAHAWDQAYIEKARQFMRRLHDRTNPNTLAPTNTTSNPAFKNTQGAR